MKFAIKPFFVFLVFLSSYSSAGKYNSILNIGDAMPSFADLPATSGDTLSSADIKEPIVVMVSLANSCPWVKGMDPGLVTLANKFEGKDVRVVGFAVNHKQADRLTAMKVHAKSAGYRFDYVYDESQELGRKLGATRTPEYFVFNKERKLAYTGLLYDSPARMKKDGSIKHIDGEPKEHYVEKAVSALLDNQIVDPTETRAHGCSVKYLKKS